jgi:hypothetical protein
MTMCRWLLHFLAWLCVTASLFVARRAHAGEDDVVVVDVTPAASALDADKLRASIGAELHALAVSPRDARAGAATGTLVVDVDRTSHALSVTYVAKATPTTRQVPLPADDAAARTAAVALAGNLARDEASELAAELRAQNPPSTSPATKPGAAEAAAARRAAIDAARAEQAENERLHATLDMHARRAHRSRVALGWTSLAVGTIATGAGAIVNAGSDAGPAARFAAATGPALLGVGFGALMVKSPFEELAAYERQGNGREATEEAWSKAAQTERGGRRGLGIVGLVLTGLAVGAGTFVLADSDLARTSKRQEAAAVLYGFGAVELLLSTYSLATSGPVETALRAYEETMGRVLLPKEAKHGHFGIVGVAGGAMASFSGTF